MQSLSRLESQRIAAVLQRATIDVSNLRYVPDKPDQSLRDLMRDIGGDAGEVGAMLYSFWQLEEGRLVMQSGGGSTELGDQLEAQARVATQRLFRTLADAPHVVKLLTGSPTGYVPSAELLRFLAALEALHGLKAPAVADVRLPAIDSDALKATIAKKQQMESDSELLQTELAETKAKRATEVQALDAELAKLTAELASLRKAAEAEEAKLKSDTDAAREAVKADHDAASEDLGTQVEKLRALIVELEAANQKEKEALRKRVGIMNKDAAKAVGDYDTRMFDLEGQCDAIRAQRKELTAKLDLLGDHFRVVDADMDDARKEEALIDAILGERQRLRNERELAGAVVIQRNYKKFKLEKAKKEAESKKPKGKKKK